MPLVIGESVGPYQVLAPIGVGGMGEVYRARDSKLNRDVALKILPAEFARCRPALPLQAGSSGARLVESPEHRRDLRL
jgi:serine/threonine protein kinase